MSKGNCDWKITQAFSGACGRKCGSSPSNVWAGERDKGATQQSHCAALVYHRHADLLWLL